MDNEIIENDELLKTSQNSNIDSDNNTKDNEGEEDAQTLKERLAKLEENYNNQKKRAEKAESQLKASSVENKNTETKTQENNLSIKDTIAFAKAGLEDEDVEEVLEYARFKKISISEALKSPVISATIKQKEEFRKTSQATYTGSSRTSNTKIDDNSLINNAKKGLLPESEADMARLASLKYKK